MKTLCVMPLLLSLSSCDTMRTDQDFPKDKYNCEQVTRDSSPYANTTGAAAGDTWATCMKSLGWLSMTGFELKKN
jgi:hypothetical protein